MEIEERTKVGDIAVASSAAASDQERYGFDYCRGGKRALNGVGRNKGLPPATVRGDRARTATATPPSSKDWNTALLTDLIRHIVTNHHEYLKLELPRVWQSGRTVVHVHGEKDPVALHELKTVYAELSEELNLHMHKAELLLFSAIERFEASLQGGGLLPPAPFGSIANPIAVTEREHDRAEYALGRIRELTSDFEVPSHACSTYRAMLENVKALEADLHIRIHLENNILFSRAVALERNN